MTSALETLNLLQDYIQHAAVRNKQVSDWSVGMQIEHCLLATRGICLRLIDSKPYTGRVRKNIIRRLIFFTGIIPRGRGQSPTAAMPDEQSSEDALRDLSEETRLLLLKAAELPDDSWWKHFSFGVMKKDDAFRFIAIHNKHHLKIIDDII